ncbi:MAG: hypothetical protein IPN17_36780 [Deltaproteobacteria bacterium]|nr:hypothetical protein [Deltaproteobacteria bacterium]
MAQVIPDAWQVPARIRQRVGVQAGRQRAIVEEGHLLLILHELPKDDEVTRPAKFSGARPTAPGGPPERGSPAGSRC